MSSRRQFLKTLLAGAASFLLAPFIKASPSRRELTRTMTLPRMDVPAMFAIMDTLNVRPMWGWPAGSLKVKDIEFSRQADGHWHGTVRLTPEFLRAPGRRIYQSNDWSFIESSAPLAD